MNTHSCQALFKIRMEKCTGYKHLNLNSVTLQKDVYREQNDKPNIHARADMDRNPEYSIHIFIRLMKKLYPAPI